MRSRPCGISNQLRSASVKGWTACRWRGSRCALATDTKDVLATSAAIRAIVPSLCIEFFLHVGCCWHLLAPAHHRSMEAVVESAGGPATAAAGVADRQIKWLAMLRLRRRFLCAVLQA